MYLRLECWDPIYMSGTVEAGNFNFGRRLTTRSTKEKNKKDSSKGSSRSHV